MYSLSTHRVRPLVACGVFAHLELHGVFEARTRLLVIPHLDVRAAHFYVMHHTPGVELDRLVEQPLRLLVTATLPQPTIENIDGQLDCPVDARL
jgi:hypothetical protein